MDPGKAKTLAGIGSVLSIFGLDEVGYALVLAGMYDLGDHYNNEKIKRNALWWFIWWFIGMAISIYIIFTIGYAIFQELIPLLLLGNYRFVAPIFFLDYSSILFAIIAIAIVVLVILEVFYVLSARRLKEAYAELANASGVDLFKTAAKLYWWGSLLVVILVGFILIWISWIISAIAFFSMKPRGPTSV